MNALEKEIMERILRGDHPLLASLRLLVAAQLADADRRPSRSLRLLGWSPLNARSLGVARPPARASFGQSRGAPVPAWPTQRAAVFRAMCSRPKSCSASWRLWARQRRVRFAVVGNPPLAKGSTWWSSS
jgi:hypothetical protein